MSHFAKIDDDNIVTQVIVAEQDFISSIEGNWIQTSYNTRGGVHYGQDGEANEGIALRKNYAGIGYTYDEDKDAFISPQPEPSASISYVLNEDSCLWELSE